MLSRSDCPTRECTYGTPSAPTKIVIVGDSVGSGYAEILRQLAIDSHGRLQTINETMGSCVFARDTIYRKGLFPNCEGRKNSAVDLINTIRPDLVIVSNGYGDGDGDERVQGAPGYMTVDQWSDSLQRIIDRFRGNAKKVVLLSPPPSDAPIWECTSRHNSMPASCVGSVSAAWKSRTEAVQRLAANVGAVWIDSRPWVLRSQRSMSKLRRDDARPS